MSDDARTPGDGAAPPPAPLKTVADPRAQQARRRFLQTVAVGTGVVGLSLLGLLPSLRGGAKRLRPPGALDEHDLLAACIKCGQCVQVCPVEALHPADLSDGAGVGVPFIDPRKQACDFSCDVAQCILACPTGALTYHRSSFFPEPEGEKLPAPPVLLAKAKEPEPTLNMSARMGVARLVRPDACLAGQSKGVNGSARGDSFKGKKRWAEVDRWKPVEVKSHPYQLDRCDLCVRECPIQDAIRLEPVTGKDGVARMLPVVQAGCVGCGVCEMMCPVEEPCIVIEARGEWRATS